MDSYNKQIVRNIIFSFFQILIVALTTFLLYRHLIKVLGVEQLGLWSLILSVSSLSSLANFGLGGSLLKYSAELDAAENHRELNGLINMSFVIMIGLLSVFGLCLYGLSSILILKYASPQYVEIVMYIIPLSLLSFALNTAGTIFMSVLEGLNKGYLKNIILIISNILFITLCYKVVSQFGLKGLAYAQLCQSLFFLLCGIFLVKRYVQNYQIFNFKVDKALLKDAISYGMNFQLVGITQMFYDPVTKFFLLKYGGLASVSYFEMASKLVLQIRGMITVVFQSLVPKIVIINYNTDAKHITNIYRKMHSINWWLMSFSFMGIIAFSGIISEVWIGKYESTFVIYLIVLSIAWLLNSINIPSYMINLGTGKLKGNSISHGTIAILNVLFCWILGFFYGGYGVVLGWGIALALGSLLLVFEYHQRTHTQIREIIKSEDIKLLVAISVISLTTLLTNTLLEIHFVVRIIFTFFFLSLSFIYFLAKHSIFNLLSIYVKRKNISTI